MSEEQRQRQQALENLRKAREPKPKKVYKGIPRQSAKKKKELAQIKEAGGDNQMDLFFNAMRKKCKGKCTFCNGSTTYKNEELWRIAIAHLLPKSRFKSIATNEENWVELCWNCHTDFDGGKISWQMLFDSHEWTILKPKLEIILPLCTPEEKKNKLYSKLTTLVYGNDPTHTR